MNRRKTNYFQLGELTENYKTKKSRKELSKLWNKYIPIFLKYNIPLTIFYGTLLGYHREQNFIENDDDIDIILNENYYDKIMEIIKAENLKYWRRNAENRSFIQLSGCFDIYFYREEDDKIHFDWDSNSFDQKIIFPTKQVYFQNYPIHIPAEPESFCEMYYGKNWRIPI